MGSSGSDSSRSERRTRGFWVFRICLLAVPIGLLAWIVDQNVHVSGRVVLRCAAQKCDPEIINFASKESDIVIGTKRGSKKRFHIISADPLYFDTRLMRSMNRADVKLTFEDPAGQRRLRLGVTKPGSEYTYYDFAEYHPSLTRLEGEWSSTWDGDLVLFQNPESSAPKFASVDDFLARLPAPAKAAMYNVDVASRVPVAGYSPSPTPVNTEMSIRGSHTLLVYVGDGETLDLEFSVQDINRHKGKDTVSFSLYRGGDVLSTLVLRDDGDDTTSGKPGKPRAAQLTVPNLTAGTYRLQILADSDDSFIRSFTSPQKLLMFENRLYIAGSKEYSVFGKTEDAPAKVYFNGTKLTMRTSHVNSLQTIQVGSRSVTLARANTPVTVNLPESGELTPITVPIRDVELSSDDGQFILMPDSFFSYHKLEYPDLTSITDPSKLDVVLARYQKPKEVGSSMVAELSLASIPKGKTVHFFILGVPAFGQSTTSLRVKELEVRLHGDRLAPRLAWNLFRGLVSNIRQGKSD